MNLEKLFDAMDEEIVIVNKSGRIVFCNQAYADQKGRSGRDLKGLCVTELCEGPLIFSVLQTGNARSQIYKDARSQAGFIRIYQIKDGEIIAGAVAVISSGRKAGQFWTFLKMSAQKDVSSDLRLHGINGTRYRFDHIIRESPASVQCVETAKKLADSQLSVLIQGERGCGKDLYAQAIHNESSRKDGVFVPVHCDGLDDEGLSERIFGSHRMPGAMEMADKGTLFFNEISAMGPKVQEKLSKTLGSQCLVRADGSSTGINVRILCASSVDLMDCVRAGSFRQDLYYQVAAAALVISPLRERKDDIRAFVEQWVSRRREKGGNVVRVSDRALKALEHYLWPGNERQLQKMLEYAALTVENGCIDIYNFPYAVVGELAEQRSEFLAAGWDIYTPGHGTLAEAVRAYEQEIIRKTVDYYGTDVSGKRLAANQLGISLATLYNKMEK